jgi:hypothetical protein
LSQALKSRRCAAVTVRVCVAVRSSRRRRSLVADLASLDQVQRDCGSHRKRLVESIDVVLH